MKKKEVAKKIKVSKCESCGGKVESGYKVCKKCANRSVKKMDSLEKNTRSEDKRFGNLHLKY